MQKGNLDKVVYIQHTLLMLWYMQKKKKPAIYYITCTVSCRYTYRSKIYHQHC